MGRSGTQQFAGAKGHGAGNLAQVRLPRAHSVRGAGVQHTVHPGGTRCVWRSPAGRPLRPPVRQPSEAGRHRSKHHDARAGACRVSEPASGVGCTVPAAYQGLPGRRCAACRCAAGSGMRLRITRSQGVADIGLAAQLNGGAAAALGQGCGIVAGCQPLREPPPDARTDTRRIEATAGVSEPAARRARRNRVQRLELRGQQAIFGVEMQTASQSQCRSST
jgi:hypothetical protein